MEIAFEFHRSAFKHYVKEADDAGRGSAHIIFPIGKRSVATHIRYAFLHPLYEGPLEGLEEKYLRIGFDRAGNLLEIIYNEVDEHAVFVFHAMKCTEQYLGLLHPQEELWQE
jgi:hypothetical protein